MTTSPVAHHMHLVLEWGACLLVTSALACRVGASRARYRRRTNPEPAAVPPDPNRELATLKASERNLRERAKTQEALLREVNHRVKNNFISIIGLLQMKREYAQSVREACHLHDMETRLSGLAAIHALLSMNDWQPIPLNELCRSALHTALDSARNPCRVTITDTPSPRLVSHRQAHHLTLIIHELVSNTLKHSAPTTPALAITITLLSGDAETGLSFADNGPGYPDPVLRKGFHKNGTGLQIIENLVCSSLCGKLHLFNDAGAAISISFPHTEPACP